MVSYGHVSIWSYICNILNHNVTYINLKFTQSLIYIIGPNAWISINHLSWVNTTQYRFKLKDHNLAEVTRIFPYSPVQLEKNDLDPYKIGNRLKIGGNIRNNVPIHPHKVRRNRIGGTAANLEIWSFCYNFWSFVWKASFIYQIMRFGLSYEGDIY